MRSRLVSVLIGMLLVYAAAIVAFGMKAAIEGLVPQKLATTKPEPQTLRMLFAGDIMLSRNIGKIAAEKKDYRFYFRKAASTTREADIAFANLESPVSTGGIRSGSIYSFRTDPQMLEGLTYAGFDVVSIANNHIWDYGRQAFLDTLVHLEESGILAVGGGKDYEEAHRPRIVAVGETRIAFLAYTNLIAKSLGLASSTPAVARFDDEIVKADIAKADEQADVVVVSFHWGDEYETKHNAEQERIAKLAIDEGADIIVGHHPHVMQEVEEYGDGLIIYSLGNFVFDQNFSADTRRGLVVEVLFENSRITRIVKKEVAFNKDYQPYLVESVTLE